MAAIEIKGAKLKSIFSHYKLFLESEMSEIQFGMNLGSLGKGISCYRSQVYFLDCVIYVHCHIGYSCGIFFFLVPFQCRIFFRKFVACRILFLFLDSSPSPPPLHISNGPPLNDKALPLYFNDLCFKNNQTDFHNTIYRNSINSTQF